MQTITKLSFTQAMDTLNEFMGSHYTVASAIKDGWLQDSKIVGFNLKASSVIRKQMVIPMIEAFIEVNDLPLRVENQNEFSNIFQIYTNENE